MTQMTVGLGGTTDSAFPAAFTDGSLHERLLAMARGRPKLFTVPNPLGKVPLHVVTCPALVRHVLVTNSKSYKKGFGIRRIQMLLGEGIFTSEGALWVRQRKKLNPVFRRESMGRSFAIMREVCARTAERWSSTVASGSPIDVTAETSSLVLDVLVEWMVGDLREEVVALGGGKNPFDLLVDHEERDLAFARAFRKLDDVLRLIIQKRAAQRDPSATDLVSLMLASDQALSPEMGERQMIDELKTQLVAGHETTASALAFLWHTLARQPEHAARIAAEVDAVGEIADPADLEKLTFTRAFTDEILRLYPPGWIFDREALADDVLGDVAIPRGTTVLISPFVIHRLDEYWETPEAFRPDRFLGEACARSDDAYLPFGMGPRKCIGEQMALSEMMLHVASIVKVMTIDPVDGDSAAVPALDARMNLRPRDRILIRGVPRPRRE